jgi:hypothetical protein
MTMVRFPACAGVFLLAIAMSNQALGPIQPPIKWVPGALSPRVSGRGVKLTTRLHLVPRLRMHGVVPPLVQCLHGVIVNGAQGQVYFYLLGSFLPSSFLPVSLFLIVFLSQVVRSRNLPSDLTLQIRLLHFTLLRAVSMQT